MASSMALRSSASMTMAGTSDRPAIRAARQRRSPAMICQTPSSPGWVRTRIGCSTPLSRIEAVSSSRSSWRKVLRGWSGLGFRLSIGTRRTPAGAGASDATGASAFSPIKADRPRPKPLCRSAKILFPFLRCSGARVRRPASSARARASPLPWPGADRPDCPRISGRRSGPACRRTAPRPPSRYGE